jgi:hypothetical protein
MEEKLPMTKENIRKIQMQVSRHCKHAARALHP